MSFEELKTFERQHFKNDAQPITVQQTPIDSVINEKYLKGEIRIVTEQARYPLNTIKDMFDGVSYILNPDFQRRHRWDITKQSRLIESFIMNVPVPPIFLYEKDFSVYEVMDGLQRITAIKDFYEDKYALTGLEQWPELNGRRYSSLPGQIKKGIDRRYISSIVLLKETAKTEADAQSLKQMVFARINSGGAKLEDQESRNAQYPGAFNEMLIRLARNVCFCDIFCIPAPDENENLAEDRLSEDLKNNAQFRTMKDVETVLRFFAMRNLSMWENTSLSNFLDRYSEKAMDLPSEVLESYKKLFEDTIQLAYQIYGDYAFYMWKINSVTQEYRWVKKANMVIYDPVMAALSEMLDYQELLVSNKTKILEETKSLFESETELFDGRNTNKPYILSRISKFKALFEKCIEQ